jgi:hypothetical protein
MSTNLKPPKPKTDRPKFSLSRFRRTGFWLTVTAIVPVGWAVVTFLPDAIDAVPKIEPAIEAGNELMHPAKIEINTPTNNSIVPLMVTFEGTARDIPTELAPWLCIYAPEIERYYYEPIELPAPTAPHQQLKWKTDPYPIGDKEEMIKKSRFQVSVVLLNQEEGARVNRGRADKKKGSAQGFVAKTEDEKGHSWKDNRESKNTASKNTDGKNSGRSERRWRDGSGDRGNWRRNRDPKEGFMGQCLGEVKQRIDLTRPGKAPGKAPSKAK